MFLQIKYFSLIAVSNSELQAKQGDNLVEVHNGQEENIADLEKESSRKWQRPPHRHKKNLAKKK